MDLHTPANAVPPLDADFEAALDAIRGIHPGLELIADGLRLIALGRTSLDDTQTVTVALAGSPDHQDALALIGYTVGRLTNPESNPGLHKISLTAQKNTQLAGENLVRHLADPDLHQHASDASAAIHTD